MYSLKRFCCQLIVPVVLILVSLMIVWKWPEISTQLKTTRELKALLVLLPALPYGILALGALMGWRYNNLGLVSGAGVLALSYLLSLRFQPGHWANTYYEAYLFLFPFNMILCAARTRQHIFSFKGGGLALALLLQAAAVALFCGRTDFSSIPLVSALERLMPFASIRLDDISRALQWFLTRQHGVLSETIPAPAIFSFLFALTYLSLRFLRSRDILLAGCIGSLAAVFLSAAANQDQPAAVIFHVTAGLILIITHIEASFFMAYNDELTGLPGRRRLNESLTSLGKRYAIAMMDIDHFKKFNDTYGHKTGDDVLKAVAAKLKEISGRAKVFRYGGEEFTAVFPGKSIEECFLHLETFRKSLESSRFFVRMRSRGKTTPVLRGRGPAANQKQVRITMSIGVAESGNRYPTPEKVIRAADKALYKAKKTGRNRVCSA